MSEGAAEAPGVRLPPAYRLVALGRVGSTNEEAMRLAEAGAEDGTLVWAREQTGGRGRRGSRWTSPPGNLYLSLVLRPECALAEAAQLGFVAALAVGDSVGTVGPPLLEITYKWPNDVLLNERKVSGILLQSHARPGGELEWLVLGVGVNVRSHPQKTRFPATDICFEGAEPTLGPEPVLEAFCRHFLAWTNRWLDDGFAPIRQTWLYHAHGLGGPIDVRLPRQRLKGVFRDLDEHGALVLELPDGTRRPVTAGELHFGA